MSEEYIQTPDGWLVNPETGEIVDGPERGIESLAAARLHHAQEQIKEWKKIEAVYKSILLNRIETEQTFQETNLVVKRRQATRKVFNANRFWMDLPELNELETEAVIQAAKDFDPKKLPNIAVKLYTDSLDEIPNKAYITVSTIPEEAPSLKVIPSE